VKDDKQAEGVVGWITTKRADLSAGSFMVFPKNGRGTESMVHVFSPSQLAARDRRIARDAFAYVVMQERGEFDEEVFEEYWKEKVK